MTKADSHTARGAVEAYYHDSGKDDGHDTPEGAVRAVEHALNRVLSHEDICQVETMLTTIRSGGSWS